MAGQVFQLGKMSGFIEFYVIITGLETCIHILNCLHFFSFKLSRVKKYPVVCHMKQVCTFILPFCQTFVVGSRHRCCV